MTTASELIPNLSGVTGFPKATVYGVYRKLNEAGHLPRSSGSAVAKLSACHVVMMLLALLADMPLKDAAAYARTYYALADENGNQIGDVLVSIIDSFSSVNPVAALACRSRVEVDCDAPRVCIINEHLETLYGLRDKQWSDVRVRRSMTISGKVLFDLAMGIHFNRWSSDSIQPTKEIA